MVVQFSCLVCNRAVAKNHRAVLCDLCDSWVHIACNNLNVYTYQKFRKDKSSWYCICYFRKELPYGSTNDTQLEKLLHGEVVVSSNPKIISRIIKQSEYLDEELLSKTSNKLYTPDEFNNALKNLNMTSQFSSMHLNISFLSYHHLELYNLISSLKIKPNIIGISETRLQKGKQPKTNISLPNYVYEHTPTQSGKGGTLLYIDKTIKYKLRKDLNIFEKNMIESTVIEILSKKQKNLIIGCVYKHPKHEVKDFTNNHMMPLLSRLSNENKDIMIMGDFNVNLINYDDDKNISNFLDTMLSHSFRSFITTPTRITRNTKILIDNIFYNKPLNDIVSGNLISIIYDHLIQFLIEPSKFTEKLPQMVYKQRCYKNFDKLQFRADLIKVKWGSFCHDPDPNSAVEHFLRIIERLLDEHAPYKNIKHLKSQFETKPWITAGLAYSIKIENKLYKSFCKEKAPHKKENYERQFKTYRNLISTLLRET